MHTYTCAPASACTRMNLYMCVCAYCHRLLKLRGQLARVSSFLQYIGPMGRNQVTKLVSDIQVPVFNGISILIAC